MRQPYDGTGFAQMDLNNPQVWDLFVRFTYEMIRRHFQHYSAYAVMHRVRWETAVVLEDGSEFKIANGWIPFYARKFHKHFPQHDGFFRTRSAAADSAF